jgi:Ca2+-binding RTX toxin-like protein
MTTGTEGNDILTNDPALANEVVDALGGDDIITVQQPTFGQFSEIKNVKVLGGEGLDTLNLSGRFRTEDPTLENENILVRVNSMHHYRVEWSGIERLNMTGGLWGPDVFVTTGESIDTLTFTTQNLASNVTINTNGGDDTITIATGQNNDIAGNIVINAGSGNDIIDLSGISTAPSNNAPILDGGDGDDVILGSRRQETINGGAGNDRLDGKGGADLLNGGDGNDVYVVTEFAAVVTENVNEGVDEVRTSLGLSPTFFNPGNQIYTLPANVENLTGTSASKQDVFGNALDNVITMGAGNDLVGVHDGGNDRVIAGGGNDYIYYGAALTAADRNDGGAGTDTVGLIGSTTIIFDEDDLVGIEKLAAYSAGTAPDAIPNNYNFTMHDANVAAGNLLTVVAQSLLAGETLTFNGQAETDGRFYVRGGRGGDTITGGLGNDKIYGNLGADTLSGGGGNDMFQYVTQSDSTAGARDSILDFSAGDKINLVGVDADTVTAGNNAFTFIGSAAFGNQAGQLRAYEADGGWIIEGDTNGDSSADLVIFVQTVEGYALGASDFAF